MDFVSNTLTTARSFVEMALLVDTAALNGATVPTQFAIQLRDPSSGATMGQVTTSENEFIGKGYMNACELHIYRFNADPGNFVMEQPYTNFVDTSSGSPVPILPAFAGYLSLWNQIVTGHYGSNVPIPTTANVQLLQPV
jgi:hypothetical protein